MSFLLCRADCVHACALSFFVSPAAWLWLELHCSMVLFLSLQASRQVPAGPTLYLSFQLKHTDLGRSIAAVARQALSYGGSIAPRGIAVQGGWVWHQLKTAAAYLLRVIRIGAAAGSLSRFCYDARFDLGACAGFDLP